MAHQEQMELWGTLEPPEITAMNKGPVVGLGELVLLAHLLEAMLAEMVAMAETGDRHLVLFVAIQVMQQMDMQDMQVLVLEVESQGMGGLGL